MCLKANPETAAGGDEVKKARNSLACNDEVPLQWVNDTQSWCGVWQESVGHSLESSLSREDEPEVRMSDLQFLLTNSYGCWRWKTVDSQYCDLSFAVIMCVISQWCKYQKVSTQGR